MSEPRLTRAIGQLGLAALAINGLIGAGIYALPAGAAELSGNFSPWAFVVCALLMSLVVMSFAQLSLGFSGTGGPVAYTKKAFGDHVAFQTTWLLYVGRLTALAANTNAIVLYISFFIPAISDGVLNGLALASVLLIILAINLFAVDKAMSVINGITLLKLLPLVAFVVLGVSYIDVPKILSIDTQALTDIDKTLLLLVYAYIGFEGAVVPAGESKNPKREIAKALIGTLLVTAILYFLIQSISISILPNMASSKAPIADAASVMIGGIGATIISIAAIVSIAGNLSTVVFTAPRMTFALSNQGSLPAWFGKISSSSKVPTHSIVFFVTLALVLAVSGSFVWLAIVSSLARLIGFFITIAALIKLKQEFVTENRWLLPLGITIPVLALVVCLWLAFTASWTSWLMTILFMIFGSVMYKLVSKQQANLQS